MAGSAGGDEPPRTVEEMARWTADVVARAEKYEALNRRVSAVSVTEVSRDGVVRVTVDASGALLNLEISDRAKEFSGQTLAAHILATLRRAQSRIAGEVSRLAVDVAADNPTAAAALVSSYRRQFPEQPDAWTGPTRQRPAPDDDWESPSVTE
ncbi:YbaB/EbfC family nucleoid-associated protein [Actinosynnema sp. CS-041913]|uniref:YbaB/EbfC family nucleoid-associated protein n=1 Tax=Actinosynnema sp. CS-041913 TaxID=3239917 RepID=UPI003D8AD0F4